VYEGVIKIKNTGSETSVYSIEGEGDAKNWATFYPDFLVLSPGEEASVNSYIQPECESVGSFDVGTLISTEKGLRKRLVQEISLNKCLNLEMELKSFDNIGCPCSLMYYEFEVKNTGSFYEIYNFEVEEDFKKWVTLTSDRLGLTLGGVSPFSMYINSPCEVSGEHVVGLGVAMENSQVKATYPLKVNVLSSCFNYSMALGKPVLLEDKEVGFSSHRSSAYELCENEKPVIVPVLIKNEIDEQNRYSFELEGKKWASLDKEELLLNGSQEGIVSVVIETEGVKSDDYNLTLNIKSLKGGVEKKGEFSVRLDNCYQSSIVVGKRVGVNYSKIETPIVIKNEGSKEAEYVITIVGEDWVSIEPSSVIVGPDEERIVYLRTSPEENVDQGSYKAVINVLVNQSGKSYQQDVEIKLRKLGKISNFVGMIMGKTVDVLDFAKDYMWYFTGGIVVLLGLIVVLGIVSRRKAEKLYEKEADVVEGEKRKEIKAEVQKKADARTTSGTNSVGKEERKKGKKEKVREEKPVEVEKDDKIEIPWKIVLYVFIAIVLGTLIFFGVKYKAFGKVFALLKGYVLYVAIGFVSLIVLIVVLNIIKSKKKEEDKAEVEKKVDARTTSGTNSVGKEERKSKKEKPVEVGDEEQKFNLKKVLGYLLIVIIIGAGVFFAFRFIKPSVVPESVNASVSENVTVSFFDTASEKVKNGMGSALNVSKNVLSKAYGFVKGYLMYIAIGVVVLFSLIVLDKVRKKRETVKDKKKGEKEVKEKVKKEVKVKVEFAKTKRLVRKKKFKGKVKNIILIVLILGVLAIAGYYSAKTVPYLMEKVRNVSVEKNVTEVEEPLPVIPANETGIKTQVWEEDTVLNMDLSQYFKDPDNDELAYSNSPLENIIVTIDNGIAKLEPNKDWYGKETVVFSADDGKGGVVKSNNVTLIVTDMPETLFGGLNSRVLGMKGFVSRQAKRLKDSFMEYIGYIMLGLFILLMVILFLRFKKQIIAFLEEDTNKEDSKKEEEEKKEEKKKVEFKVSKRKKLNGRKKR
tara:strand:+ start:2889 stop:5969 length:3081 start_codon:yes stop_codon:yes gene_type:complete